MNAINFIRPNYETTLNFQYSNNTPISTINDMVKFMLTSAEWIHQENFSISSENPDWSSLEVYCGKIQASMQIVLESGTAIYGVWNVLACKIKSKIDHSLFEHRSSLDGIELPPIEKLPHIVELLGIILSHIHHLGRYYRQLSRHYCELCLFSGDVEVSKAEEFKLFFHNLLTRVESVVKDHIHGWRYVILVTGHALLIPQITFTPLPAQGSVGASYHSHCI